METAPSGQPFPPKRLDRLAGGRQRDAGKRLRGRSGFTLIEALVALSIFGVLGVAVMSALSTGARVVAASTERNAAAMIAESQVEHVRSLPYATAYTPAPIPADYPGYTAEIGVAFLRDGNLQQVTVTVKHQGTTITMLEGYKANR